MGGVQIPDRYNEPKNAGKHTMREVYNAGGIQCKRSTMQKPMIWHAMVGHYTCSTNECVRNTMSHLFASMTLSFSWIYVYLAYFILIYFYFSCLSLFIYLS